MLHRFISFIISSSISSTGPITGINLLLHYINDFVVIMPIFLIKLINNLSFNDFSLYFKRITSDSFFGLYQATLISHTD